MPVEWNNHRSQYVVTYDVVRVEQDVPHGLCYRPRLLNANAGILQLPKGVSEPDELDWTRECDDYVFGWHVERKTPPVYQTKNDFDLIEREIEKLNRRDKPRGQGNRSIVEVGVNVRDPGWKTFTRTMLATKDDSVIYLGIDRDPKNYLNDERKNVFTVQCDSYDQAQVSRRLEQLGVQTIDVLLIDGYHSVAAAVNDWRYSEMLSTAGVVLIHDINCHPGPMLLMDAIDPELYDVQRMFSDHPEYGLGVARRLTAPSADRIDEDYDLRGCREDR